MQKPEMINIAGPSEGRVAPIAWDKIREAEGQSLIVVSTLNRAKRLQVDLSFFSGDNNPIYILPPEEESFIHYEARSNDSLLDRVSILKAICSGEKCTVIAPVTGAIRKLPPRKVFEENILDIRLGDELDLDQVRQKLMLMGYERCSMIEGRGEYSIRGGIIDIFTPESDLPFRIELFDTEVDSIRSFDPDTQRSVANLKYIRVCPCTQIIRDEEVFARAKGRIERAYDRQIKKLEKKAAEAETTNEAGGAFKASAVETEQTKNLKNRKNQLLEYVSGMINLQYMEKFIGYFYEETMYIWDYMDKPQIIIDDPARILETLDAYQQETSDDISTILQEGRGIAADFACMSGTSDYFKLYDIPAEQKQKGYIFTPFVSTIKNAPPLAALKEVNCRQTPAYNGRLDVLRSDLEGYKARGYEITIVCSSKEREENIREFIIRYKLEAAVKVVQGVITGGMEFADDKIVYLWDGEIFGDRRKGSKSKRPKRKNSQQIKSFADVEEGDFVVHESHGIGKFVGIKQMDVQGVVKDYLQVKYAGSDMLYVPVDQLGLLQKYIGGDGVTPHLNKLSGSEWKTTKAKAKAAVMDMAEDIIRVSAKRMGAKGYPFAEDTPWQKEFEDDFPYVETDDQLRCIEEIKKDMEKTYPMDRLLCGDVGFGKTEVAARALFKCNAEGKQAAVLVPTTLLANQHYYTLKDRFEKFPFKVEMLSRFRTAAQQREIIKKLEAGEIDLIIGTHRLLSKDIKFKDLGLLVIDEEQRFGVRHKEKIKQLKENVDVLTLSATPIPRTLHMSLSGIRDMSTIDEPPEDRYPVQTYVMEEDDFLIREVIEKEIGRGGQVFVLHNRVSSINSVASRISTLVPKARVAVGHGKMNENQLEDIMAEFAAGEYDVLVSTTIIESGIDIPNANTMIVLDADRFGLSQLYQLRGRVGRSGGRMAYAYLMYRRDKNLTEIAEKRLRAIKDFTEFGSGFRIAMKDLELRGAGNLLGTEQSGHMLNVGYELYCKLLEEAVAKLSPDAAAEEGYAEETTFNLPISAVIPEWYIRDEVLRLQMYKKIAMVHDDESEDDVVDELLDRFGDVPKDTMNLIKISKICAQAGKLGVRDISQQGLKVKLLLMEAVRFPEGVIPRLAAAYGGKIKFNGGVPPYIRLTVAKEPGKPGYAAGVLKELEIFFKTAEAKEE